MHERRRCERECRYSHVIPLQGALRPLLVFEHRHEVVEEAFVHELAVLFAPLTLSVHSEACLTWGDQHCYTSLMVTYQNGGVADRLRDRFCDSERPRDGFLARTPSRVGLVAPLRHFGSARPSDKATIYLRRRQRIAPHDARAYRR